MLVDLAALDPPDAGAGGLDPDDFAAGTGWTLKPEGACRGEVCVPLPLGAFGEHHLDLAAVAERLGMPLVTDPEHELVAVGPASVGGRALDTVEAPNLELPLALSEGTWRLADQRGRRTVVIAWAPW